jgi:hypothetical protein
VIHPQCPYDRTKKPPDKSLKRTAKGLGAKCRIRFGNFE